jgi:hypothetical protein
LGLVSLVEQIMKSNRLPVMQIDSRLPSQSVQLFDEIQ